MWIVDKPTDEGHDYRTKNGPKNASQPIFYTNKYYGTVCYGKKYLTIKRVEKIFQVINTVNAFDLVECLCALYSFVWEYGLHTI